MKHNYTKSPTLYLSVFAVIGLIGGFYSDSILPSRLTAAFTSRPVFASPDRGKLTPSQTYQSVLKTIRSEYAPQNARHKSPDPTHLTYVAIDGMLETLKDRYTEFWTPGEYARNMEETSGVFAGIGATLDQTSDGRVVILEPIENSPAAKMGILSGDVITHVNNQSVRGKSLDRVIDCVKGDPGTSVRLTIQRKNHKAPMQLLLTRAMVASPLVESRMEDTRSGIGYISLSMFGETADKQFSKAVARLESKGLRGLIFDLRDNPGGLLNVAQDLSSRFVSDGPVVWIQEKNGKMTALNAEPENHQGELSTGRYPIVVLVNGNSASAAEIVAGSIKDHKVGTLVGSRTFGKGLVQTIFPLNDDSAVKITTQHYFTPNKIDINKKYDPVTGARISGGILPDVAVDLTDADWDRMHDARRESPQDHLAQDKWDPQLQKAMEILRKQLEAR